MFIYSVDKCDIQSTLHNSATCQPLETFIDYIFSVQKTVYTLLLHGSHMYKMFLYVLGGMTSLHALCLATQVDLVFLTGHWKPLKSNLMPIMAIPT